MSFSYLLRDLFTNVLLSLLQTNTPLRLPGKSDDICSKSLSLRHGFLSLPEELLTDIFLRLPVKSLLRCKSVCKEWNAIISSSSFVKNHFDREGNLTRLVMYTYGVSRETRELFCAYSYFPNVTTLERHATPDNSLLWGEITYLRGPCYGIFCIYITKNKFALWNPTTRRLRLIQCCPSYKFSEVGFGVDPLTHDFKIVLFRAMPCITPFFAVYTSSNDSWRYVKQESLRDTDALITEWRAGSNTYLNGFYYWTVKKDSYQCFPASILAFDMHNEIFEEISMPGIFEMEKSLHLLNDSVALVSYNQNYLENHIDIWLMKEKGCWTKFLSVECCYSVLEFCSSNEMIMYSNHGELVVYDLDAHSPKLVKLETSFFGPVILPILYKESLFSLKGEYGISQDYDTQSAEALDFLGYEGPNTKISCGSFREGVMFDGDSRLVMLSPEELGL